MKSILISVIIGVFIGFIGNEKLFHSEGESGKPTVTIDSTSYWKVVELSARVDSFQKAPDHVSYRQIKVSDTITVRDTIAPQIASNEVFLANVYDLKFETSRGQDTVEIGVSFCEFPKPLFSRVEKWNPDRYQVKEITKVITLPPKKPMFVHGISIGPAIGLLNKKIDFFIGYTLTFNLRR